MSGRLLRLARTSAARRVVLFTLLACPVVAAAFWLRAGPGPHAVAQETTSPSEASPPAASPSAAPPSPASPSAASPPPGPGDLGSFLDDASASPSAEEEAPEGIPGLGAVNLISALDELTPDREWSCGGPDVGDGSRYTWTCADPTGSYSVEVVGADPLAVLSVTATAQGVPDREAEQFFGYVLRLSLEDGTSALDPDAWAAGTVPSGGTTFAGDAEISIYGDDRRRAMTVASTADLPD